MKAHIVLAHPERQSFNGSLADTTASGLSAAGISDPIEGFGQLFALR